MLYGSVFNKQGGTEGVYVVITSSINATINNDMPKATAPSKSGYAFGGYYSETDGKGTQYYTAQMKSANKWDIAQKTTLHAYWVKNGNSNSDTPSTENKPQTGKSVTLNSSNFNSYFTYTHSVSIEPFNSNKSYITTTSAIYYYSAKPKVNIKTSSSLPIISIKASVSFYKNLNDYSSIHSTIVNISLYDSNDFQANSTWNMAFIPKEAKSYKITITSVSGTIYVIDN